MTSLDGVFEDLYEDAPCGLLSLLPSGEVVRVNRTLLTWTGYTAEELHGGKRFPALLTAPGALLYESYCVPLLRTRGSIGEISLDLLCRDGTPLPVLLSAVARVGSSGELSLFRVVILNAPRRREYERELLLARTQAEDAAEELRIQRVIADLKVVEQDELLQAMGRMAAGDLETPIPIEPESTLVSLERGLDRMRRDILRQIREMKDRNSEILRLNAELLHQIEQRSRLLFESMQSAIDNDPAPDTDDRPAPALAILPPGTVLAKRYRVEAVLGRGAMGIVYEVERASDGRRFAAKVLSSKPDYRSMARFAREALLLARLQHPNLIAIVDLDITADRVAYLVMELVQGKSLAELGARYGDREFMLPVLRQVADALTTVHSAGIVHRDLKPANVLVSMGEGGVEATAMLADFGISRLLDITQGAPESVPMYAQAPAAPPDLGAGALDATFEAPAQVAVAPTPPVAPAARECAPTLNVLVRPTELAPPVEGLKATPSGPPPPVSEGASLRKSPSDALTEAGALVGTPLYMAPELLGGASLARPSSDIFSFGVMAYEVLSGTVPFEEPPLVQAARGRGLLRVAPLDTMCHGLPPALARLLERCLSLDPASRPTALELTVALGKVESPR